MMTFGEQAWALRQEGEISQRALADQVGIDVTYLSKIENDRMPPPSHETIVRLADALGADPDELLVIADKIPEDLRAIITKSPAYPAFFRMIGDLTEDELQQVLLFVDELRKRRSSQ